MSLPTIGERLGHYRLTAQIGQGGMGVVYRARDEELNRDVAVTGQLPFGGSTPYGLSAAILHELPRPLPPSVPPGLSAVILRCLAKDLKNRFQRAGEIRSTLETLQSAAIVSEPRREEPAGPRTLVLRGIQHLDVKNGDVLLLLGTTKGRS